MTRPITVRTIRRVVSVIILLPLFWSIGAPWFIHLDPIAFEATWAISGGAALAVAAVFLVLTWARLSRGLTAAFPYKMGRDFTGLICLGSILRWVAQFENPLLLPEDSFAILGVHLALGLVFALPIYITGRHALRDARVTGLVRQLPHLSTVFVLNAVSMSLMTAMLFGVGLPARSSNLLDDQRLIGAQGLANTLVKSMRDSTSLATIKDRTEKFNRLGVGRVYFAPNGQTPDFVKEAYRSYPESTDTIIVMKDGRRYQTRQITLRQGSLWLQLPIRNSAPIDAPEDGPALFILVLMLLGAPAATWLVAQSLKREFRHISRALGDLGHGGDVLYAVNSSNLSNALPGVPICSNDETGDLAVELNKACRHFEQSNKRLMKELRFAAQSDRAQSQFLTSASQQLRSPIEGILKECEALKRDGLTSELSDDVDTITKASMKLSSHVVDMVHLSGLEDWRQVPLRPETIDVIEVITDVIRTVRDQVPPEINLEVVSSDALPLLFVDRKRLQQVIENLVSNALKFTTSGFVRVTAAEGRFPDGTEAIHLQVWDSGPGLREDELDVIFSEFYRSSKHRNVPGSGLGLTIARRLVERHSGRIWAESILGEGSVFHILLPTGGRS